MLKGFGNIYQDITCLLPRLALDQGATCNLKLAASDRKCGMEVGELASQSTVKRGHLELMQLFLSPIYIYYLLIFKLLVKLDERFLRKGSGSGARGMALVSWVGVCKSTYMGELGIFQLQAMNLAWVTKWVGRHMHQ